MNTVRRDQLPWKGSARDHVRLACSQGPVSGEWLAVHPAPSLNTVITDRDFRSLCRWWLGLPLLADSSARVPLCPLCATPVDIFGDHFVSCPKNGPTARHNALRDAWAQVLVSGGISHAKEVATLRRDRPADILLRHWDKGKSVAVDFVVSHPLSLSSTVSTAEGAHRHLKLMEASKLQTEAD